VIWSEHEFRNNRPATGGGTEGDHAELAKEVFAEIGFVAPVTLQKAGPDFPSELSYLWEWFCQLSGGLGSTGIAPPKVTWENLRAWRTEMRMVLLPWESLTLINIGTIRANVSAETDNNKVKTK
jgi:hypothetical protein